MSFMASAILIAILSWAILAAMATWKKVRDGRVTSWHTNAPSESIWAVEHGPAQDHSGDHCRHVDVEYAVRLISTTGEKMTLTTLRLASQSFESDLNKALLEAEDKASAINAAYEFGPELLSSPAQVR